MFSKLYLLLKSPPMRDRPTASLRLFSRSRIWVSKTSKGSLGEKKQLYTRTLSTSTQMNPALDSRKSSRRSNQGYKQGCRSSLMHPETKKCFPTICTAHWWAVHRPPSPWQSASGGPGHPSPFRGWVAGTSLLASQPPKLFPEEISYANWNIIIAF